MSIKGIAVNLSASIAGFASGMVSAAGQIGTIRAAFNKAVDSGEAYKKMTASIGELKLAGGETLTSFRAVLDASKAELNKFMANTDVKVAIEIASDHLSESWIRTKAMLQSAIDATGLKVGASVITKKGEDARAWIADQRRKLLKPITVRVELARRAFDSQIATIRSRLESLNRFRSMRIAIAAVNLVPAPAKAALATLGPLTKLARAGITVALRASHYGVAAGVKKAQALLGGLGSFGRNIASMLTSSFALVGGALAALGVYSFGSFVKSSMDAIDSLNDQAVATGISTEALSQLGYAARMSGSDQETLNGALTKLNNNLSDAALKGGPAAAALATLGLDARELATASPDQALLKIATAMQGVTNPAQRTAIAMDLFGKSGAALVPLLGEGEEGIKSLMDEAVKLGVSFNSVDAAKIAAANDAIDRTKSVVAGVGNTLAVQLAPYVEAVANRLTELGTAGGGLGPKIGGAIEWVATAIASTADYLQLLPMGFHGFRAGALQAIASVLGAVDMLGGGLVKLMNLLPGVEVEWTDTFANMTAGLEIEAAKEAAKFDEALGVFQRGDNAAAVKKVFDDIKAGAQAAAEDTAANANKLGGALRDVTTQAENLQKVSEALATLKGDTALVGLGEIDSEIAKLKELGATEQQLADARSLLTVKEQLNGLANVDTGSALTDYASKMETLTKLWADGKVSLEQFNALRDTASATLNDKLSAEAKSIADSVKSPLDSYNEEITKLQTLLEKGLITQDVFDKASLKAKTSMDSALQKDSSLQVATPKALQANTADAQRLAYDSAQGVMRSADKNEIAKKSLTVQEEMSLSLAEVAKNTRQPLGTTATEISF